MFLLMAITLVTTLKTLGLVVLYQEVLPRFGEIKSWIGILLVPVNVIYGNLKMKIRQHFSQCAFNVFEIAYYW